MSFVLSTCLTRFSELTKYSRVGEFIKLDVTLLASEDRNSVPIPVSFPSLPRCALHSREDIRSHPSSPAYIPFSLSEDGQGCLAKSPKACTPGGIQPPSCLRPGGRIAWRPSASPMHFHPPGSCFVKLDLRMACRRFVIPAGYILAKTPPALVISRSMNSRVTIFRGTRIGKRSRNCD